MRAPAALSRVSAAACLLAALAVTAVGVAGLDDPVRMPVLPWWTTAPAAVVAAVLVAAGLRRVNRGLLIAAAVSTVVTALGSLAAIPHTVLIVLVWAGAQVTGGSGSFDVAPVWPVTLAHLATVAAVGLLAMRMLSSWRLLRGRCARCGRHDAVAAATVPERHRKALPWLAAVAVIAALPYETFKLGWSFGWQVGLVGDAFDDVSFTSPGFGDTAVLTMISITVSVLMGARVALPVIRAVTVAIGGLGSLMLLPVGVIASVTLVPLAFGLVQVDDSEIATWAFAVIYLGFLVWGLALTTLTWTYVRTTRRPCADHTVPAPASTDTRRART